MTLEKIAALENEIANCWALHAAAVGEGNEAKQIALLNTITACRNDLTELVWNIEDKTNQQKFFRDHTMKCPASCQEELTLERAGAHNVLYPDGSSGNATVYDSVIVELSLSDGSVVQTSVVPVLLQPIGDQVGVECTERILGYPALDKMNLKLDFRGKKLVKRIRRI